MKKFEAPKMEIEELKIADIITASVCETEGMGDNDGDDF